MIVYNFDSHNHVRTFALAAALPLFIPLVSLAAADTFQTAGGGADVYASFSESCNDGTVFLYISGSAQKNPASNPKTQSDAQMIVTISGYNSCTQNYIYTVASAPIQYSQILGPGSNMPKTITVSAQNAPALYGNSDTVTFDVTVNATGQGYTDKGEEQIANTGNPNNKIHISHDGQQAVATGSLTISTMQMGPLPVSNVTGDVYFATTHVVTVNP